MPSMFQASRSGTEEGDKVQLKSSQGEIFEVEPEARRGSSEWCPSMPATFTMHQTSGARKYNAKYSKMQAGHA